MTRPETGYLFRWLGIILFVLAVALLGIDLALHVALWPLNFATMSGAGVSYVSGTKIMRQAIRRPDYGRIAQLERQLAIGSGETLAQQTQLAAASTEVISGISTAVAMINRPVGRCVDCGALVHGIDGCPGPNKSGTAEASMSYEQIQMMMRVNTNLIQRPPGWRPLLPWFNEDDWIGGWPGHQRGKEPTEGNHDAG
jgi:hypothetical protein